MTETHTLPFAPDKGAEMLNRRCDVLYNHALHCFSKVFARMTNELAPLLVEIRRSFESAAEDARFQHVAAESIPSLMRLVALCEDIDAVLSSYQRSVVDRHVPVC